MCELTFKVNQINEKNDPCRGWELQFGMEGDCQSVKNAMLTKNIQMKIGSEIWSMSANFSEITKRFSEENFLWYIKGGEFEPKKKKKYKNVTQGTMHYSHEFICALLSKYPKIKQQIHCGHFSVKENCIYIEQAER